MTAIDSNLWVLRPRPNPQATVRLICLPNAGAGPQEYHAWPPRLPAGVEVSVSSIYEASWRTGQRRVACNVARFDASRHPVVLTAPMLPAR